VFGTVIEFDEPRGLGVVEGDDGERYPFHCTRIADGSRTIAAGSRVEFSVMAGPAGRWEADAIAPVDAD
jgi:cold shock CspA family protein